MFLISSKMQQIYVRYKSHYPAPCSKYLCQLSFADDQDVVNQLCQELTNQRQHKGTNQHLSVQSKGSCSGPHEHSLGRALWVRGLTQTHQITQHPVSLSKISSSCYQTSPGEDVDSYQYTFTLSTYLFPFVGPRLCPWGVLLLCNWITSVGLCVTDDPCLPSLAQTQDRRRRFLQDVLGCPSFRLLISQ